MLRLALRLMGPGPGFTRESDPLHRVRKCGWVRIATNVSMEREREGGRCRYGGLVVCGGIHVCPVCSANIRHRRMMEIELAALAWLARGGSLVMVTLTTRHYRGMPLDSLWSAVSGGWNRCNNGRQGKADRERWRMAGFIRSTEVTEGENGWHPHVHGLMFVHGDPTRIAAEMEEAWFTRWSDHLARQGLPRPSRRRGVVARPVVGSEIGTYLAKVQDGFDGSWSPAHELARGDLKKSRGLHGRTPFGLLREYADTGSVQALAAWREWEQASKGRRAIEWSRGLRQLLEVEVLSDQQAAERAEYATDPLYLFTPDEWDVVLSADADWDLIEAAEEDGTHGVVQLLRQLFGFDQTGEALACSRCVWTHDGLRTKACPDCERRLRAVSGRNL